MNTDLVIKDLRVNVEDKEILKGLNLTVKAGAIHAIMGPNGSGKSTLAYTLMGHPGYTVTGGEVWYQGQNILELDADDRSKLGLFLAFQYPVAIPGVTVANFLRSAINAHRAEEGKDAKATSLPVAQFRKDLREKMAALEIDESFVRRYLNEASRAARRSGLRSYRWPCSSRPWQSWTRPTRASTSTRSRLSRRASTRSTTSSPRWACW